MSLLCISWVLWILGALLVNVILHWRALLPQLIQDALSYGKIKVGPLWPWVSKLLRVPKRWFTHFYLWGSVWNSLLLIHFITSCKHSSWVSPLLNSCLETVIGKPLCISSCPIDLCRQFEVLASLGLVCLQVFRRVYECLFVSVFSTSASMHLVHYILGMYFYTALGPTALLLSGRDNCSAEDPARPGMECRLIGLIKWYHVAGLVMFLWATFHQWRCHKILGRLRASGSVVNHGDPLYSIPRGDWFELVSSPHYLAEVLIYTALVVFTGGQNYGFILVLLFTILFLLISARQVHDWYLSKFEDYPKRHVMFPWIW